MEDLNLGHDPVHYVMKYDDAVPAKRKETMLASQKHDGVYGLLFNAHHYSRTGKYYPSGDPLAREAFRMAPDQVIIGEFMLYNEDGTAKPVNEISGAQRRMVECPDAYFIMHDAIPVADFIAGICNAPFTQRYRVCKGISHPRFIVNKQVLVTGESLQRALADERIAMGHEGVVFKDPQGAWEAGKRDASQLKIVRLISFDLRVNSLYEGKGKYVGTLGGLLLEFRRYGLPDGEQVLIKADGMTDYYRDLWWDNPDLIVNKIIKVEAMQYTSSGVLRQPKTKDVRDDKRRSDLEWTND